MSRFLQTEANGGLEFTEELIRTATGHFDITIATSLSLPSLSIRSIERPVTSQLIALTSLDISKNNLTSISGLTPLARTLVRLDCSYNNIVSIEPLIKLPEDMMINNSNTSSLLDRDGENNSDNHNNNSTMITFGKLEVLRLQGNMIRDMGSIVQLPSKLPKLRAIYFREQTFKGSNPVCDNVEDYAEQMAKYFSPKCRCIDGHYFCHESVKPKRIQADGDDEITLPLSKNWVNEQYFAGAVTENAGEKFGAGSEKEVKMLLGDLKKALETKI